jgi:hypothetical protein
LYCGLADRQASEAIHRDRSHIFRENSAERTLLPTQPPSLSPAVRFGGISFNKALKNRDHSKAQTGQNQDVDIEPKQVGVPDIVKRALVKKRFGGKCQSI